jgi:hypothetical protein
MAKWIEVPAHRILVVEAPNSWTDFGRSMRTAGSAEA